MYGKGIIKGLGVTLKHFLDTYIDDIRMGKKRYTDEGIEYRSSKDVRGLFTVQYPEEKLPTPEEFRFVPFLVYDEDEAGVQTTRCTSCGICAKVCPPQCIWIERSEDPKTGRPIPDPANFFIDIDICMNCGLCAEFCPFDAIIMDHDYELAVFDRFETNIFDKEKLLKPAEYYQSIRPYNYKLQADARVEKEAKKAAAIAAREAKAAAKAAAKE
ncbi:MAG: 4Fe-4S binding protein [Anaerolineales bacterium]|nr:4Fe-4S binding protein [Chloroflexota bacterium]MBL6980003.1 4Fe-4S binding protein [Anaerolineales bacterium]